jgi:hypothetical protein
LKHILDEVTFGPIQKSCRNDRLSAGRQVGEEAIPARGVEFAEDVVQHELDHTKGILFIDPSTPETRAELDPSIRHLARPVA